MSAADMERGGRADLGEAVRVSYLERVAVIRTWNREDFRPFLIDARRVGRVRHNFARLLADYPKVFEVTSDAVALLPDLGDVTARSGAVHDVIEALAARGEILPPRGETYGVSECWAAATRLRLDRGAVPLFGVKAYGVHVNGFVRRRGGLALWIGTRAKDKRVAPGKLDHMVAGGLGHGYGVMETLIKEAAEEAAVPAEMARRALPVGALTYLCEMEKGLRDDTLFLYDLEVPPDFEPRNTDGELQRFELWPARDVMERVRDSDDFKFNVGPVMIDFFLRHGLLDPDEEPQYPEIVRALHATAE